SNTIVGFSNFIDFIVLADFVTDSPPPFLPVSLNYDEYVDIAGDIETLMDRLDIVLTSGTLDPLTRQAIVTELGPIDDLNQRARIAIYMMLISADYAVRQ
ncbi:MAG: DUF1800 domain-containing protein, partial [Gammaproteobacteria bacterium]|nr:DUF1800 domain-containing protein [Gammaproteobacteria bacterium]